MRRRMILAATAAMALASIAAARPVAAGSSQGGVISVEVQLSGFSTPSRHWDDPCDNEPPEEYRYQAYRSKEMAIPIRRDANLEITNAQLDYPPAREQIIATYGPDVANIFVETHTMFVRYCYDPTTGDIDAATQDFFWVPLVTQQSVVPELYKRIWDYIDPPRTSWPSMDQDFGWLYVQAPMDFRIESVSSVSVTATVSNITGSVIATVTATPQSVTLEPGEPGGLPVDCPLAASTASYAPEAPGLCSYTYRNSSAIESDGKFDVLTSVRWTIETTDPTFPITSIRTWSRSEVAVAEAQAVVTG